MKKYTKKSSDKITAKKIAPDPLAEMALNASESIEKPDPIRVFPTEAAESLIWEACIDA